MVDGLDPRVTATVKSQKCHLSVLVTMDLDTRLRTLALSLDADYYGVADLSSARQFIHGQGGEKVSRYPRAIVMGMVLPDSIVDLLPDRDKAGAILYRHSAYDVVNLALDQIALRVANFLRREGFDAFPVPASKRTERRRRSAGSSPRNWPRTSQASAGSGRAACSSHRSTAPGSAG